jgi:hypothetical protein
MDINELKNRIKNGAIDSVSIVGQENGDLLVMIMQKGDVSPLTNTTNQNIKPFRSPDAAKRLLIDVGVDTILVNLTKWNVSEIFDPHKRAYELKQKTT